MATGRLMFSGAGHVDPVLVLLMIEHRSLWRTGHLTCIVWYSVCTLTFSLSMLCYAMLHTGRLLVRD